MCFSGLPRHRLHFVLSIVLAIPSALGPGAVFAQSPNEPEQRIRRIQDAILPAVLIEGEPPATTKLADRMSELHVPGVSVAVIHDGKIEWARGFGVARIGGPAVTPETLFQAASISKPVTALAVSAPGGIGEAQPRYGCESVLKNLESSGERLYREDQGHAAGVTNSHRRDDRAWIPRLRRRCTRFPPWCRYLNGEQPANTTAILVDTLPGSAWRYSGGGFVVTQLVLENVTGQAFPTLMHNLVLGPIGMSHSTYQQPLPPDRIAEAATPYQRNGQPVPGGGHTYPEMAPAGLWTTPSDLARYAIEVQKALAGKSNRVLSQTMAREMLKPGKNQWGLGVGTGGGAGHSYFTHSGANEGFQCDLVAYDTGDGAAIMTNSDNGGQLAEELLRTIASEYKWPDFAPRERKVITVSAGLLRNYAGVYALAPGFNMTITVADGQLISRVSGQEKVPLFAESETMFFPKVVDAEIEFPANGAKGPASQLILHQNGQDMTAKRLDDAEAKKIAEAAAAFDKRFKAQTPAPGSEAAVRGMIEGLRSGKPDYDAMSSGLAEATRQQLPQLQSMVTELGAMQAVTFKGVGPGGADIYQVKFEKGSLDYRIWLGPDGKIESANVRPSE